MDKMDKMEEVDLREIFSAIRKHSKLLIFLPLIAMFSSLILNLFVFQPIYQAETTLVVNMNITTDPNLNGLNNSLRLSRELVPTYKELITSRKITDKVNKIIIDETEIENEEHILSEANVQAVGNTEIMRIMVNDHNPKIASLYANVLAEVFAKEIPNIMNIDNVKIIDEAKVPEEPIKPNKKLNILIAGILGLMVALGIAFIIEFLDNTYKKPEDIKRELGLPVLGTIPRHDMKY